MPFSRITTNFCLEYESVFVDSFHQTMMSALKIPDHDRFVLVDQRTKGFYQPTNTSGKYIVFEIDMFSGRTIETKRKLYKDLVVLANSVGVVSANVTIILQDIDKENWGIRGGQPASEVELGFNTDI